MEQRGCVHELDARGEFHVAVATVAAHLRGRQRQHRPEALAAGVDEVPRDLGNEFHVGPGARPDQGVDPRHSLRSEAKQRLDARARPLQPIFQR